MPDTVREAFDSRRRLCPDGACVGVIGSDGRCSVCGTPDGGPAAPGLGPEAFAGGCADGDEDQNEAELAAASGDENGGFDPRRGLCPDGACVGVLGSDGRCKVCGARPGT